MTAILERRESESLWGRFCNWITSTENRLYIGWFGGSFFWEEPIKEFHYIPSKVVLFRLVFRRNKRYTDRIYLFSAFAIN